MMMFAGIGLLAYLTQPDIGGNDRLVPLDRL